MSDYILATLVFVLTVVAGCVGFAIGFWTGHDSGRLSAERKWWRDRAQ